MKLDKKDKELISKEIENLEKLSSVELVSVITKRSNDYKIASLVFALFSLFTASLVYVFLNKESVINLLQIQFLSFICVYIFFEKFKNTLFLFLPKKYKYKMASQNARKQFYNLKLNKTKNRQSIMFFVSFDEKYVEIITDKNISEQIPNTHWQFIIDEFTNEIKNNELLTGYLKAIKACSAILIEKFPIQANDENEISNEVIELL